MLALWSPFLKPSRVQFIAPVSIYRIFLQFCSLFFLLSSRSTVQIQITYSLVIIQLPSISCFISSPLSWLSPSALHFHLTYLLASSLYHAKAISQPLPIFFLLKSLRHHLPVTNKNKNLTVQIPQPAYFHHHLQQTHQTTQLLGPALLSAPLLCVRDAGPGFQGSSSRRRSCVLPRPQARRWVHSTEGCGPSPRGSWGRAWRLRGGGAPGMEGFCEWGATLVYYSSHLIRHVVFIIFPQ